MRKVFSLGVLAVAVVCSLASAAPPQQQGYPAQGQPGYSQDPTGCDQACAHYFQCKGLADQNAYGQCVQGCQQQNPDPQTMVQYAQLDCATAIAIIEQGGAMQGGGGTGGQAGGPQPGSQECQGCKRWDDQCAYVVETAVGSGPYSGMVQDCPQSCCPR
jgi:hypothetical protein